ncbi:MAG: N-acetylmuramoyl-L-alanine amidase [Polyangiaceae bacterium]
MWLGLAAFFFLGCGGRGGGASDAGITEGASLPAALATARGWSSPGGPLFRRAEALVVAHTLEAGAAREGAGARAAELHREAGALLERTYRLYAKDQDGKEAAEIFLAASRDRTAASRCAFALRGARLMGEVAHDPALAYKELHRAEVRLRGVVDGGAPSGVDDPCVLELADAKRALEPFRPAPAVLAAVEHGVIGEGDLPTTSTSAVAVSAPHVVRVDAWPGQDATRVVIELDRPATFRVGDEGGPAARGARTFVDLDGVEIPGAKRETPLTGVVSKVSAGATSTGTRVLLELDGQGYRRVFHLLEPYRVVVDVARKPPDTRARRAISRVLLDPGHGGADPGAIGPSGLREADVTVDIARRTAKALAADGITVVVTRDGDKTVSLEERAALANSAGADLFVSVHCNAAENRAKHGVETYVLDTASDIVANRVAARENATSVAASSEIGGILASLRLSDQAKSSVRLAELVQRAALASIRPSYPDAHDGGVHRAGFYVLVGARMPSVLFETSYISNADEEARLRDETYRQRLADGVANAIRAYREGR